MDKKQAIKSIEHFTEASLSAVYDGNAPATKSDLQKLRSDIAQLILPMLSVSLAMITLITKENTQSMILCF